MYKLEKLNYEYEALEPYIDTHTLALHHKIHQGNYLKRLNELLIKNNYDYCYSLEELNHHLDLFALEDQNNILFNLGGVINHNLYFKNLSPNPLPPNIFLQKLIDDTFQNFDNFKKEFKKKALSLKGSGYTFLVIDKDKLKIVNLKNQDNPYLYNYIPLLTLDLWEHAYYLNYENKKDLYIDNFFLIMDFKEANKIFE